MELTELLIARHGNTFDKGEVVRRVGSGSDLPLSSSGRLQAEALGHHLAAAGLRPDHVLCSHLQRTRQTAEILLASMGLTLPVTPRAELNEIDYGPDEGLPESDVLERLGAERLRQWDEDGTPPPGWKVDPAAITRFWQAFANDLPPGRHLVVTSNGIARFAPAALCPQESTASPKLKTAAYGHFLRKDKWQLLGWNLSA